MKEIKNGGTVEDPPEESFWLPYHVYMLDEPYREVVSKVVFGLLFAIGIFFLFPVL